LYSSKIVEMLIEILADGKWHSVHDIHISLNVTIEKLQSVLDFLSEYNFVIYEKDAGRVKVDPLLKELILTE
jgi:hypothetical protein